MATTSGKRAFWMHQGAEYVIGVAFLSQGLQSRTPIVPTILGVCVLLNTACAKGPLSAFRVFGRRTHRALDVVFILLTVAGAVQPFVHVDRSTRLIMGLLAFVLTFIWLQSDFSESKRRQRRPIAAGPGAPGPSASTTARPRQPDGTIPDSIGRTAGRLAGKGVNMYRARKAKPGAKS